MKKKQEFIELLKRQLEQHVKARIRNYPCSSMESGKQVYRVPVSDDMVHWDVSVHLLFLSFLKHILKA